MAILSRRRGAPYRSMSELLAELRPEGNYAMHCESSRASSVALFAPHGGCIEPGTDRVVVAAAGSDHNYFVFRGLRPAGCYRALHVTSARYDAPSCLRLARASRLAVSVHGCEGAESFVEIGGGNHAAVRSLRAVLIAAGYHAVSAPNGRRGEEPGNFINLAADQGVQLELSAGFRAAMFPGFPRVDQVDMAPFRAFVSTLRLWLGAEAAAAPST